MKSSKPRPTELNSIGPETGLAPDYMHAMFSDRESVTSIQWIFPLITKILI